MRFKRSLNGGRSLRSALVTLLVLSLPVAAHAQRGTITGRIVAAGTNQPLADSRVILVGTSISTISQTDGGYTLRNVPTGALTVRVLRVGYQELKKTVNISAGGQVATLDFALQQAVVQLQEIVTTATGDQRRVEIGNAVTTLGDVATKVETQPITNLADLLVAKAPGVTVLPGVMTGAAPTVRIRGLGSLATNGSGVSNNPIYVVDGVRLATNTISFGFTGTNASLINDLNPNEIEDIEIVKGPSAATLYGTDAANGVIVITTKKGHAGSTRWTWWAEGAAVDDRNKYPSTYASWGHDPTTNALKRCTLVTISQQKCVQDSLTSFNVFSDPSTTALRTGHRDGYGGNASGGTDQVRFFVSADIQNELGPVHMPDFAQRTLDSMGTANRDEWLNPEQFQSYGARTNLSAAFTPRFDFAANAGFSNTNQRLPQVDNNTFSFIYSGMNNPGFNHAGLGYNPIVTIDGIKVDRNGYGGFSPAQIFQVLRQNGTQRFLGSGDAKWRPFDWMQNQATAGVDLANNDNIGICRFGECPNSGTTRLGSVRQTHTNIRNFSAKVISSSTWQARSYLSFITTLGSDYTNQEQDLTFASGQNLPPGAQTVGDAATKDADNQLQTVNKTLGLYAQEQMSYRDRMFFVVAARSDQNSSFGTKFQRVFYPKVSLSWILSDESFFPHPNWLNQFRLRAAYGASGVQPGGTVALQTFGASTANIASIPGAATGADTPGLLARALGNPALKPERSSEFEGGFETNVLNNRAHLDVTYYNKRTKDALISRPIAASSGASALSVLQNLASVSNTGVEVTVNTTLFDRRAFGWDVTVGASHNSNKILSLGVDDAGVPVPTIGAGTSRDTVGLPVNAVFARPFTYDDVNHDGIITPDEVTVQTTGGAGNTGWVYLGYSQPRDIVSITNGIDLFSRKLRLTVLTDYKGGFILNNSTASFYSSNFATWYSENLPDTPLWDQARTVANSSAKNPSTDIGFRENGQFWKLREVSAALTLPNVVAERIRARDVQLVFSARNLHTWTSYTGTDPESNYSTGDVQTDFSTTSPRTYYILRANLHY
jgi:TonB-linked SusC/RagA family outer membrane protein